MSTDCPYCGARSCSGWTGEIFDCRTDLRRFHGDFRHLDCYKREVAQLRAELLRCYNVIPGVEKVEKLPDLILGGCVSDTIHAFTTQQDAKIKELESLKEDFLKINSMWDPQQIAGMLGGQIGEFAQVVIQREVPKLVENAKSYNNTNFPHA